MKEEVKSLHSDEVFGDIIDMELDKRALSIFDVTEDHVFQRNGIARGHHLFAQANSLAVAVMDDDLALTVKSTIDFLKPVKAGDRVVARAEVKKESLGRSGHLLKSFRQSMMKRYSRVNFTCTGRLTRSRGNQNDYSCRWNGRRSCTW